MSRSDFHVNSLSKTAMTMNTNVTTRPASSVGLFFKNYIVTKLTQHMHLTDVVSPCEKGSILSVLTITFFSFRNRSGLKVSGSPHAFE